MGHDTWGTNPPTATTNEQGEFAIENRTAGPAISRAFRPGEGAQTFAAGLMSRLLESSQAPGYNQHS
jgi:hypothetical protein